ncbi:MAG: hypothetical protein AAGG01_16625, partial [Planctomycetota bacterium]
QAATPPFETLGFGQLCLGAPYRRAPSTLALADASGYATSRVVLADLPNSARPQPGSTWTLQWMYRDRGSVNTSSARTVLFQ